MSNMLKKLKSQNPDKEYPSNIGQKWTIEEENILLEELDKNIDINLIAQAHNRTIGGIIGRQKDIAYKMHINKTPIEEIIIKTKLSQELILETIEKKETIAKKETTKSKMGSLENEVIEMKMEINDLKNTINELIEMLKLVHKI
jgi:hypothetical protein